MSLVVFNGITFHMKHSGKGEMYFLLWLPHLKLQWSVTEAPLVRPLKGEKNPASEMSGEEQSDTPIVGLLELTLGEREGKHPQWDSWSSRLESGREETLQQATWRLMEFPSLPVLRWETTKMKIYLFTLSRQATIFNSKLIIVVCIQDFELNNGGKHNHIYSVGLASTDKMPVAKSNLWLWLHLSDLFLVILWDF